MSRYNIAELGSFDPLAEHPFATSTPPSSSSNPPGLANSLSTPNMYFGSSSSVNSTTTATASASTIAIPSSNPHARLGGQSIGRFSSYNEHLQKSLNAPPQSFLASSYDFSPSPPSWSSSSPSSSTMNGAPSSSPLGSSTSSSSTNSSSGTPLGSLGFSPGNGAGTRPSYLSKATPSTAVFTDFRAQVELYRQQGADLDNDMPVLRKKKSRAYEGFN